MLASRRRPQAKYRFGEKDAVKPMCVALMRTLLTAWRLSSSLFAGRCAAHSPVAPPAPARSTSRHGSGARSCRYGGIEHASLRSRRCPRPVIDAQFLGSLCCCSVVESADPLALHGLGKMDAFIAEGRSSAEPLIDFADAHLVRHLHGCAVRGSAPTRSAPRSMPRPSDFAQSRPLLTRDGSCAARSQARAARDVRGIGRNVEHRAEAHGTTRFLELGVLGGRGPYHGRRVARWELRVSRWNPFDRKPLGRKSCRRKVRARSAAVRVSPGQRDSVNAFATPTAAADVAHSSSLMARTTHRRCCRSTRNAPSASPRR